MEMYPIMYYMLLFSIIVYNPPFFTMFEYTMIHSQ